MRRSAILRKAVLAATLLLGCVRPGIGVAAEYDYCSAGQNTSLLVVDRTTRFDSVDQDILSATVGSFFARQLPGERVLVVAVGGAYTELRIVFNECRPGCPPESFFARLTSPCRGVVARGDYLAFEARFIAELAGLLRQHEEAAASDIFRSVAEATRMIDANGFARLRQLLLYSDLLEASSIMPGQTIRRVAPNDALRRLRESRIRPFVEAADVRVIGFGRDDAAQRLPLPHDVRRRVEEIWQRWFAEAGAKAVQIGLR